MLVLCWVTGFNERLNFYFYYRIWHSTSFNFLVLLYIQHLSTIIESLLQKLSIVSIFFFIVVNAKNLTICWVLAPYMLFPSENVACRALEGILTWTTLKCTTLCWSPQNLIFTIREGERWSFPTLDLQFTIFQWRANHYLIHQV